MTNTFKPDHMNAAPEDFEGNNGIGRYIFFPGSDGRARKIAEQHFVDLKVKEHPRHHNLYLGTLVEDGQKVDVASISSGMGTPSLDIIMSELLHLGAKRFLRVGTSGLLQRKFMNIGDLVIGTGAIRDEGASRNYVPLEYPSIASVDTVIAATKAMHHLGFEHKTHTGLIHSKDSLYAREFEKGPLAAQNKAYMDMLREAGVVASEMEASLLFVMTSLYDHKFNADISNPSNKTRIKSGALCVTISDGEGYICGKELDDATNELVKLCRYTILEMAKMEQEEV